MNARACAFLLAALLLGPAPAHAGPQLPPVSFRPGELPGGQDPEIARLTAQLREKALKLEEELREMEGIDGGDTKMNFERQRREELTDLLDQLGERLAQREAQRGEEGKKLAQELQTALGDAAALLDGLPPDMVRPNALAPLVSLLKPIADQGDRIAQHDAQPPRQDPPKEEPPKNDPQTPPGDRRQPPPPGQDPPKPGDPSPLKEWRAGPDGKKYAPLLASAQQSKDFSGAESAVGGFLGFKFEERKDGGAADRGGKDAGARGGKEALKGWSFDFAMPSSPAQMDLVLRGRADDQRLRFGLAYFESLGQSLGGISFDGKDFKDKLGQVVTARVERFFKEILPQIPDNALHGDKGFCAPLGGLPGCLSRYQELVRRYEALTSDPRYKDNPKVKEWLRDIEKSGISLKWSESYPRVDADKPNPFKNFYKKGDPLDGATLAELEKKLNGLDKELKAAETVAKKDEKKAPVKPASAFTKETLAKLQRLLSGLAGIFGGRSAEPELDFATPVALPAVAGGGGGTLSVTVVPRERRDAGPSLSLKVDAASLLDEPDLAVALAAQPFILSLGLDNDLWTERRLREARWEEFAKEDALQAEAQALRSRALLDALEAEVPKDDGRITELDFLPDGGGKSLQARLHDLRAELDALLKDQSPNKRLRLREWQRRADYFMTSGYSALGEQVKLKQALAQALQTDDAKAREAAQEALTAFFAKHPELQAYYRGQKNLMAFRLEALKDDSVPDQEEFSPAELGYPAQNAMLRMRTLEGKPGLMRMPGPGSQMLRAFESFDGTLVVEYKTAPDGTEVEGRRELGEGRRVLRETVQAGTQYSEIVPSYDAQGRLVGKTVRDWEGGQFTGLKVVRFDPEKKRLLGVRVLDPKDGTTLIEETTYGEDGSVTRLRVKDQVLQRGKVKDDGSVEFTESVIAGSNHKPLFDESGTLRGVELDYNGKTGENHLDLLVKAGLLKEEQVRQMRGMWPSIHGMPLAAPPRLIFGKDGPVLSYEYQNADNGTTSKASFGYDSSVDGWVFAKEIKVDGRTWKTIELYRGWDSGTTRFNRMETFETQPYVGYSAMNDMHVRWGTAYTDRVWDAQAREWRVQDRKVPEDAGVFDALKANFAYTFEHIHGFKEIGAGLGLIGEVGKTVGYGITSQVSAAFAAATGSENQLRYSIVTKYQLKITQLSGLEAAGMAAMSELREGLGEKRYKELRQAWAEEYRLYLLKDPDHDPGAVLRLRAGRFEVSDQELGKFLVTGAAEGFGGAGREFARRAGEADNWGARIGWGLAATGVHGAEFTFQSLGFNGIGTVVQELKVMTQAAKAAAVAGKPVSWGGKAAAIFNPGAQTGHFLQHAYFQTLMASQALELGSALSHGDAARTADALTQMLAIGIVPGGRDKTKNPGPNKTLKGFAGEVFGTSLFGKMVFGPFAPPPPGGAAGPPAPKGQGGFKGWFKRQFERAGYDPNAESFKLWDQAKAHQAAQDKSKKEAEALKRRAEELAAWKEKLEKANPEEKLTADAALMALEDLHKLSSGQDAKIIGDALHALYRHESRSRKRWERKNGPADTPEAFARMEAERRQAVQLLHNMPDQISAHADDVKGVISLNAPMLAKAGRWVWAYKMLHEGTHLAQAIREGRPMRKSSEAELLRRELEANLKEAELVRRMSAEAYERMAKDPALHENLRLQLELFRTKDPGAVRQMILESYAQTIPSFHEFLEGRGSNAEAFQGKPDSVRAAILENWLAETAQGGRPLGKQAFSLVPSEKLANLEKDIEAVRERSLDDRLPESERAAARRRFVDLMDQRDSLQAEIRNPPAPRPEPAAAGDAAAARDGLKKAEADLARANAQYDAMPLGDASREFMAKTIRPLQERIAELKGVQERLEAEPVLAEKVRERTAFLESLGQTGVKPPENWPALNRIAEAKLAALRRANAAGPADAPLKALKTELDKGYTASREEFADHIDGIVRQAEVDLPKGYVYRAANTQWLAGTILNNQVLSLGLVLKPKIQMRGTTGLGYEFYASKAPDKIPGIKGHFGGPSDPGIFMRIKIPEGAKVDITGQQGWGRLATADMIEVYNFKTKQFVPLKSLGLEGLRQAFLQDFQAKTGMTPEQVVASMAAEWQYYSQEVLKPASADDVIRRTDFQKFSATTQLYIEYLKSLGLPP